MWGRTRPNDTLEFGGKDVFSPWYKFGDSCTSNCSFVSGDASVGFALIVFYFITKKNIYIYLSILSGLSLGFIRISAGGHFLSDVVFSQIIVTGMIFLSYILFKNITNE
jgi:lipid A 4'-phosphatase